MPTSLVTGGAGFIGSHVVKYLLDMGHETVVLDDLSGGSEANIPADSRFIQGTICDADLVNRVVEKVEPDFVFHLAAYAAEGLSHYIRHYNYEVNVLGSVNLINAAVRHGVKRFVFASSAAVYGHQHNLEPKNENGIPYPIDPYGIAKLAVERDLLAAFEIFDLPFTIFRMHNVYGLGQNINDPYRNVIGIFMKACLEGRPLPIFGDGTQSRQFTYIDQVAPYIARCADNWVSANEIFNLGSSSLFSINEIAECVASAMNVELRKEYLPKRSEVNYLRLDHTKAKIILKMGDDIPLAFGLARMAAWAKTQPLVESKPFTNLEIEQGLPESWRKLYEH